MRDHQPDILFQGDTERRRAWELENDICFWEEQIRFVARTGYLTDVAGREAHLQWMKQAGQHLKALRRRR